MLIVVVAAAFGAVGDEIVFFFFLFLVGMQQRRVIISMRKRSVTLHCPHSTTIQASAISSDLPCGRWCDCCKHAALLAAFRNVDLTLYRF